jgi:hypothetical protein
VNRSIDAFEYRSQIFVDLGIPETDNAISLLFQPDLPLSISCDVLLFGVMPAVKFDN